MANTDGNVKGDKLPYGAYSKIARRLRPQVTPHHVRLVDLGKRTSPRVSRAIARYRESLQHDAALQNESAA